MHAPPEVSNDLDEPGNDAALVNWKAEDLAGLAENDRQSHAVEETDENGLRGSQLARPVARSLPRCRSGP